MRTPSTIVFGLLVTICLAQVTWWIVFQLGEANRFERAAAELRAHDTTATLAELGAGSVEDLEAEASRRRWMFASEGAALGLLVLVGVVFVYVALLRERRIRAEQQRFLAGATHELKTPLTTIRLGLESFAAGTLPEAKRGAYLDGMLREVDRLGHGLTNLLVAAGHHGAASLDRRPADLADDVRAAVLEFEPHCAAAGVRCSNDALAPCPVQRDERAIRLVLHNLLDNAVKYSTHGGHIDVRLHRHEGRARLTVTDDGAGIPRDELKRVFKRFWRGSSGAHVGGTGLGLALVDELVRAHGGTATVESKGPGHGSRFTINLPVRNGAS